MQKRLLKKYKTVLFYVYGVQLGKSLNLWKSDPFDLTIKVKEIYSHRISEDKGLVIVITKAFESIFKNNINIKHNIKILFESCEESSFHELSQIMSDKNKNTFEYINLFSCENELLLIVLYLLKIKYIL